MSSYDCIIVGGGICGLYAALQLQQRSPSPTFLLLEKNAKEYLGGRANNDSFYGASIAVGAGIGRKEKDTLLLRLLKDMNVPFSFYPAHIELSESVQKEGVLPNILTVMRQLRKQFQEQGRPRITFRAFATSVLGKKDYRSFLNTVGYTDFEEEDAAQTLYCYGMEDNVAKHRMTGISIPWHHLIAKMAHTIGFQHIRCSTSVLAIHPASTSMYAVVTQKGQVYLTKQVIVATTASALRRLFPQCKLYHEIMGQPFLRVYGKFSKASIPWVTSKVSTYTVLPRPLQKIIPIEPSKGIYMIAYSDNESALFLKPHIQNTLHHRAFFCRFLEDALLLPPKCLTLTAIRSYFWTEGTHYYLPLDKSRYSTRKSFLRAARHPAPGIFVVGEVVAANQGWVEGGLQSVQEVLPEMDLKE